MRVVGDAIQDGVCEGGLIDYVMPGIHGELTGDDRG